MILIQCLCHIEYSVYKVGVLWRVYSKNEQYVQLAMGKKRLSVAVAVRMVSVKHLNAQLVMGMVI